MGRSGQKTAHNRLPLWSASQHKQLTACQRRWAYNRVLKLPEPQGEKAARGSAMHRELELWNNIALPPTSREARGAMVAGPPPGMAESEVPVRFDMPGSNWLGYIDLVYSWDEDNNSPLPLGDSDVCVIHDWKFTSSLRYALTAAELAEDVPANLYAYEAFQAGFSKVLCRWIYTKFDSQTPKEVRTYIDRESCEALVRSLDKEAAEANSWRARILEGSMSVDELPRSTDSCFAFGQVCPRKGVECHPGTKSTPFAPRRIEMATFEENIAKTFGLGNLPPLPPKAQPAPKPELPALPPLPTMSMKLPSGVVQMKAEWVAEAGFVNPAQPIFPVADCPETAIANGNVHVPKVEKVDVGDDLDTKSKDELKAIAAEIGATHAPKAREPGIIAAIRARRAELQRDGAPAVAAVSAPEPAVVESHFDILAVDAVAPVSDAELRLEVVEGLRELAASMLSPERPEYIELPNMPELRGGRVLSAPPPDLKAASFEPSVISLEPSLAKLKAVTDAGVSAAQAGADGVQMSVVVDGVRILLTFFKA